jgi:hypothetical protein
MTCFGESEYFKPSQLIELINQYEVPENYYSEVIDGLVEVLDRYVFLDILKSPPNIEEVPTYKFKADLIEKFKNLPKDKGFYEFYNQMVKELVTGHDGHARIQAAYPPNVSNPIDLRKILLLMPIDFKIEKEEDTMKVYAKLTSRLTKEELEGVFGEELIKKFESLQDSPIKTISGTEPIEYLSKFGSQYNNMKSPHAAFTYAMRKINGIQISRFPFLAEEVENIIISYENTTLDYEKEELNEEDELSITFDCKFSLFSTIHKLFLKRNSNFDIKQFEKFVQLKNKNNPYGENIFDLYEQFTMKDKISNINWDYEDESKQFKCKEDTDVNVILQHSFMFEKYDNFFDTLTNCLKKFDENTKPIVVIQSLNGGGMEDATSSMQELIQPRFEIMNYQSLRNSTQVKQNLDMPDILRPTLKFASRFSDLETCTPFEDAESMYKELETEDYGNATHVHTKPFIMTVGPDFRKKIDAIKKGLKNRRKPTEIIVYTDGFSYSATSFFIKGLQEFGGAIIVGYDGNPIEGIETFDAAQSPSGYLDEQIKTEAVKKLESNGFFIDALTVFASYDAEGYFKLKPKIPREFRIRTVDERIELYDKYSDDLYNEFIQQAKEIFKKYENSCSLRNLNLHLDAPECDKKMENSYTHGGYVCGSNGKWDKEKCEAYYCDTGYFFDQINKKCVRNPCASIESYTPAEAISNINKWDLNETFYADAIVNVVDVLDRYVFLDISQNPPQPKGHEKYHNKVDLIKKLREIELTDIKFYSFYQQFKETLNLVRDGHLGIKFTSPYKRQDDWALDKLIMIQPVDYKIESKDGDTKVYAKLVKYIPEVTLMKLFGMSLITKIKQFENTPIKTIKKNDPIDYIAEFRKRFTYTKSPHGAFSLTLNTMNGASLSNYPLSEEEMTNIEIVYQEKGLEGDTISYDYVILKMATVLEELHKKNPHINIKEFESYFEKQIKIAESEVNIFQSFGAFISAYKNDGLHWDYEDKTKVLKCRADLENYVNVYYQSLFSIEEIEDYYDTVKNCLTLFDNNTFPIVVIEDMNPGGMEEMTFSFQEFVQPKLEVMNYHALRNSQQVKDNLDEKDDKTKGLTYASRFSDMKTCIPFKSSKEIFEELETEDYGNDVKHVHTKPMIMTVGRDFRKKIDEIKKTIKNIRKPTEIIVYTDGYSYSATSVFIKGLQEFGGAIIVGYNGNPHLDNNVFDGAQAPSGYLDNQHITESIKSLESSGFKFGSVTVFESFTSKSIHGEKPRVPKEYEIMPIDDRVYINSKYDDDLYPTFIEEAKKIFEKYKTKCNINNLDLILDAPECDEKLEKYTHGGYPCNSEGEWDKEKCVPYYCDTGYYFDKFDNKCHKNPCSPSSSFSFFISFSLLSLFTLLVFL